VNTLQKSLWLIAMACSSALAERTSVTTATDPRIRVVDYDADQVTLIAVQRGTATRIALAAEEKILRDGTGSGFAADCAKPELEWCIHADPGTNQVLVKPKDGATHNNLELRTDKRDYSFEFEVLGDDDHDAGGTRSTKTRQRERPVYRVRFRYPSPPPATPAAPKPGTVPMAPASSPVPSARETLRDAKPEPRNWRYTMQPVNGADDIVPDLVFDDGRFTYFRFPANREIPTIFYISASGEEGRVNFHIDDDAPDTVVVERMSRRFVLRLGNAAVGIWNEDFDTRGVPPRNGTTVDGVARTIR
jgi:type IV secretion system protein VirB9